MSSNFGKTSAGFQGARDEICSASSGVNNQWATRSAKPPHVCLCCFWVIYQDIDTVDRDIIKSASQITLQTREKSLRCPVQSKAGMSDASLSNKDFNDKAKRTLLTHNN